MTNEQTKEGTMSEPVNDEILRFRINSLLSSMKVEEYGLIPQSETLECIMRQIASQTKKAELKGHLDLISDLSTNIGYSETSIFVTMADGKDIYLGEYRQQIETELSELTKLEEK